MTQFNESFYTDDFDQEMLDFIKEDFKITKDINEWDLSHEGLIHGEPLCYFWTDSICDYITDDFKYLTKQEFKDKIGMTDKENTTQQNNTFTKDMLVSGEHVVETREGIRYLVAGGMIINLNGYQPIGSYEEDLEFKNLPLMSIDKIYSGRYHDDEIDCPRNVKEYHAGDGFKDYLQNVENFTLIWKRESPEKQKQREVIQTLEEDLKRAQNALEEAKSKLEEM